MKTYHKKPGCRPPAAALALALLSVPVAGLGAFCLGAQARPAVAFAQEAAGSAQLRASAQREASAVPSTFHDAYTAWPGYATTAADSIVPGAVPVGAPASATARLLEARGAASVVLRQAGQADYAYVMAGDAVTKHEASTWNEAARLELPAGLCRGASLEVVDNALVAVLETGQIAMMSEDLDLVWTSAVAALPQGAVGWGAASQLVADGGSVYVALTAVDEQGAPVSCEVVSVASIDGAPFWQASFAVDAGAGAAAAAGAGAGAAVGDMRAADPSSAPSLLYVDDALVLAAGDSTVRALDPADGAAVSMLELDGAIQGRLALAGGAAAGVKDGAPVIVAGTSQSTVCAVRLNGGQLELASSLPLPDVDGAPLRLVPVAPAVAGGQAYFSVTSAPQGGVDLDGGTVHDPQGWVGGVCAVRLHDARGALDLAYAGAAQSPYCLLGAPLAVVYGPNAREATLEVYAVSDEGELHRCSVPGASADGSSGAPGTLGTLGTLDVAWTPCAPQAFEDESAPDAPAADAEAQGASASYAAMTYASPAAPVAARDGSIYFLSAYTDGAERKPGDEAFVIAVKPDASRAASTPVGGSEGLDTLAGALAGITLPNGAGLGAGVLVFVAGFAAYFAIRNRGGRRVQDEGLDEWRSQYSDRRR